MASVTQSVSFGSTRAVEAVIGDVDALFDTTLRLDPPVSFGDCELFFRIKTTMNTSLGTSFHLISVSIRHGQQTGGTHGDQALC